MKKIFATIAALSVLTAPGAPLALAAETTGVDADARFAEGNPPVIPHKIVDNATGDSCLSCHLVAGSKAPLCPHPVLSLIHI
jgi:nitrate reductase cytochrome c-type subunit